MNDTLYREATTHEIIERTDVIYLAVLPVGIDYEAAWGYARSEDNGVVAAYKNDDLVILDKVDVMAAVDQALGIKGDDDE